MTWDVCCLDIGGNQLHISSVCAFINDHVCYDTYDIGMMLEAGNQWLREALIGSMIREIRFDNEYVELLLDTDWIIKTLPERPTVHHNVLCHDEYWRIIDPQRRHFVFEKEACIFFDAELESWEEMKQKFASHAQYYGFEQLAGVEILSTLEYMEYTWIFLHTSNKTYFSINYIYGDQYWILRPCSLPPINRFFDNTMLICDPTDVINELLEHESDETTIHMRLVENHDTVVWEVSMLERILLFDVQSCNPAQLT